MEFNKAQLEAINHIDGNCCVLASAGSGKTTVLIERIKNLVSNGISAQNILAITFSRKAADNMKIKLENTKVSIDTFHALGYKILKESGVISAKTEIIKEWTKKKIICDICTKHLILAKDEDDVRVNDILSFIAHQKNNLISHYDKDSINFSNSPYSTIVMMKIYAEYEKRKKELNNIDFDDMILWTYILLRDNDEARYLYQNRFKYILVDEMQDTNKGQYEIIRLMGKSNNNVFVVGDPLQCIYEWRMACNDYLIQFHEDWDDVKVIPLNINYRSSSNIVKLANKLVFGTKETTHVNYLESESFKSSNKEPEFTCYDNESAEASRITENIVKMVADEGLKYDDISILTRTNFQLQAIERALFKKNIPYDMGESLTFYKLKEIKDMISFLRLAHDNNNDDAFIDIFNTPNRYLGKIFLEEVAAYAKRTKVSYFQGMQWFKRSDEWRYKSGIKELVTLMNKLKRKKKYNVGELICIIRQNLDYDSYISKENFDNNDRCEKIENLDVLVDMASEHKSIKSFLDEVDSVVESRDKQKANGVNIMTIHRSKGLEFPVVFIVGVNSGILPHQKTDNVNEERRLLYVAITRAENELYISSTERYSNKTSGISEFIYDIFDLD